MKKTYDIFYFLIEVSKEDSAYLYFMMEASEGLAFYSTINSVPEKLLSQNLYLKDINPHTNAYKKEIELYGASGVIPFHLRLVEVRGDINLLSEWSQLYRSLEKKISLKIVDQNCSII